MVTKYYNIGSSVLTHKQRLELAKQEGYTHIYRWDSSSNDWAFFAKSFDEAENEAVKLYLKERSITTKGMSIEDAEKYYSEYIEIIEINEELETLNS